MYTLRHDSFDETIYNEIYVNNSYRIKQDLSDMTVIDIGCHIGTFIKLAVENGAKFVDAYELFPKNFQQCLLNVENYENVRASNKVVWRSDIDDEYIAVPDMTLYSKVNEKHLLNTGGETIMMPIEKDSLFVEAEKFDDILKRNYDEFGKIDLVKMDCEGSEYPILYTSEKLELIDNMVLEYHFYSSEFREEVLVKDRKFYNEIELGKYLIDRGFTVYIDEHQYMNTDIYHGNMFAMRDKNSDIFQINYLKGDI